MDEDEKMLYGDDPNVDGDESNSRLENEDSNIQPENDGEDESKEEEQDMNHEADEVNDEDTNQEAEEDAQQEGEEAEEGDEDDEEDDSDEDNIQVVINQDKIEEAKTKIGIKPTARQLPSEKKGRFNPEDFDKVGTIDGAPAHEVDLEAIEDKPWRKPGADITDYFNYGFTEDTWAAYCSRQKRLRMAESGAGMPNSGNISSTHIAPSFERKSHHNGGTIPTLGQGIKRHHGSSDHRGSSSHESSARETSSNSQSGIAVLTADKREYSKKIFDQVDFSRPPPGVGVPPPSIPPPNFAAPPPPSGEDFDPMDPMADYAGGYEPTQESQWVAPPSTYVGGGPHPSSDAPPGDAAYDDRRDPWERNGRRSSRDDREDRDRKRRRTRSRSRDRRDYRDYRDRRDRDRDRGGDRSERDRDRDRDRERERRDRDKRRRSRSRSPRGSRSPSGSSRHKKSKREKREKSETKSSSEIKKEVKEEPQEYAE